MKNKVSFASVQPLMLAVHKGESKLVKALTTLRAKHKSLDDPAFAAEFIAFGESNGYSTRWLGDILRECGIKRRASGGGRKPKPEAEKKAAAFDKWLEAMPAGLTAKQRKAVAAKLAKA